MAHGFEAAHRSAAAGTLDHADQRHAIFARHAFGIGQLAVQAGIGSAAPHREVIGGQHHRPAINQRAPEQEVCRLETKHFAIIGIGGKAGERADLAERTFIGHRGNAFAGIEPAHGALFRQLGLTPHQQRGGAAAVEFVDLWGPAHGCRLGRECVTG